MRTAVAVVTCALASACVVDIDYTDTAFLCPDDVCPDGFDCVNGVCVAGGGDADGDASVGNFSFARELSFDNSGRGELTGFTVLVTLDGTRIDYSAVSADGADIAFVDRDGSALPHEIEVWDPAGTSLVWVRVPAIDADSTTDFITMQYGDPNAGDSQAPNAVWSDYQAVYHLRDDLLDSTSQQFHGTNVGTTETAGFIGPGRAFNGVDQYIDLGSDLPFIRNVAGFTLSMWLNPNPGLANDNVAFASSIDGGGALSNLSRAQIIVAGDLDVEGNARTMDGGSAPAVITDGVPLQAGEWNLVTLVADFPADTLALYFDGAQVATQAMNGFAATSADTLSTRTTIGVDDDLVGAEFTGAIDAVHLRNQAMDAEWVAAQHQSMTDQLITYGPEQEL